MRFYGFLSYIGLFAHKVAQTWLRLHETWHRTLFDIYYCVDVNSIENLTHIIDITCFFGTFGDKLAQTWFVLQETCHTTLCDIYYCVKEVGIENHNHMLEITCKVAIL